MNIYILVSVDHTKTVVEAQDEPLKRIDWQCRTDGDTLQYMIEKTVKTPVKAWFERGTQEVMRDAANRSKTGIVLWDKRHSRVYKPTAKAKAIFAKMEKLL